MKLIKIDKNKNISVVEVPDIQCEEPLFFGNQSVEGKTYVNEPAEFLLYSDTMLDKLNKLNNIMLYIQHYWEADEHYEYDAGSKVEKVTALSLFLGDNWTDYQDDLILPVEQIVANLKQNVRDSDYVGFCMEEDEYREYESEKERKELEKAASEFSSKCGHPVGTPQYVIAIQKAINGALDDYDEDQDGEAKMERWAAHQYCGTTSSFWDDEDYIKGRHMSRIESLEMVLQWLHKNCPLLMLKMEEKIKSDQDLVEA